MNTLKTIAEFMGWEYDEIETVTGMGNLALIFPDDNGPAVHELSRDDLQLVLERFDVNQISRYETAASFRWALSDSKAKAWYLLPTQTLADIAAQVIGETT